MSSFEKLRDFTTMESVYKEVVREANSNVCKQSEEAELVEKMVDRHAGMIRKPFLTLDTGVGTDWRKMKKSTAVETKTKAHEDYQFQPVKLYLDSNKKEVKPSAGKVGTKGRAAGQGISGVVMEEKPLLQRVATTSKKKAEPSSGKVAEKATIARSVEKDGLMKKKIYLERRKFDKSLMAYKCKFNRRYDDEERR